MKRLAIATGTVLLVLNLSPPAHAVPVLQLGMVGGVYDQTTATIVASGEPFELFALLTPKTGMSQNWIDRLLNYQYFVSAAVVPKVGPAPADLGSVSIAGSTYDVTGQMVYGTPPIENISTVQPTDPHDLPQHGIFETYYLEVPFYFSRLDRATTQNTAEVPGTFSPNALGGSYYATFVGDTTGLLDGYELHFDLYNEVVARCKTGPCTDIDVDFFAPFSHDAQTQSVPEPAAGFLALMGLLGSAVFVRRVR